MTVTGVTLRVMSDLIEPHLRHLRARGLSDNTIDDRRKLLRQADRALPMGLEQATVEELADFLAGFHTNQTKATYYGHLKGFFDWACERGHLDWSPAESLARPRVPRTAPRPVTDDELADLLDRAQDPFRRWAVLAAYAGLRAIEISRLERKDFTEQTITVRGKGGSNAVLPCHPEIWRVIADLPPGRIASNTFGRPVSANHVSTRFGLHCRRIGLPGVTLHRLRHWFGTTTLQHCRNLRVVQELLRHSSPATTAIYTQVTDGERQTAIKQLPALTPSSR